METSLSRLRIVYVIPTMGCGGAEVLLGTIARQLAARGHEVHILCLQPHHETWPNYPEKDSLLREVPLKIIGGSVNFRFLRSPVIDNKAYVEYIEQLQPDIIHAHLYLSELMVYSHVRKATRYFSHGHDNIPQLSGISIRTFIDKTRLTNFGERRWLVQQYKKAQNTFVAISADVKKYIETNLPKSAQKIVYLPNAINTDRFHTSRNYTREQTEPFKIISIANLVPKKNHTFLIDVVKYLTDQGYKIEAEILGAGPLLDELNKKVQDLGLKQNVFFRGSVGDVPERLWQSDLYVHPAWYEPFGLVLLEAMASGLPVVALDGYGNRELMKEGLNGYLVPADASAAEFAKKIIFFIENPKEIERQGRWAQNFSKNYDINSYVNKLIELYTQS
jgi:glycosyltransferase involved in cell wall biosynthesis